MGPPKTPKHDVEWMRQEYREGRSLREIAADVGYSHVHVRRLLQAVQEPIRAIPKGDLQKRMVEARTKLAELQAKAVPILFKSGMDVASIATAFQKRPEWVLTVLRDAQVYVPPNA